MGRLVSIAAFLAVLGGVILLGGRVYGPILAGCVVAIWVVSRSILPRSAHRSFQSGNPTRARRVYWILRWLHGREARNAIKISIAACAAAEQRYSQALALLGELDPNHLGETARAVWHNNRSYALARSQQDPSEALSSANEALRLRPSTAPFRHTRAAALIELERIDEAIAELESAFFDQPHEDAILFEAERCYDLGRAWSSKGETDYGREYFARAFRLAPTSLWGRRAGETLSESLYDGGALALHSLDGVTDHR